MNGTDSARRAAHDARQHASEWRSSAGSLVLALSPQRGHTDSDGPDVPVPAFGRVWFALVWRFRTPHHSCGESEMRTSEPKPH